MKMQDVDVRKMMLVLSTSAACTSFLFAGGSQAEPETAEGAAYEASEQTEEGLERHRNTEEITAEAVPEQILKESENN